MWPWANGMAMAKVWARENKSNNINMKQNYSEGHSYSKHR